MLENSDNTSNESTLYQIYSADADKYLLRTVGELKMKRVMVEVKGDFSGKIKREYESFGFGNNPSSRLRTIEFIVT